MVEEYTVHAPLYPFSFQFPFEKDFDFRIRSAWLQENLFIPIMLGIGYVTLIFKGPQFMESRKAFNLRMPLAIWNILFAIVSFLGALRTLPEVIYLVKNQGFYYSACSGRSYVEDPVIGFWIWGLVMCKTWQLIDTVFLVLRKKDVTFLHGYHHFTDLYAAGYTSLEIPSPVRWFMSMNFFVHGIMNTYFALRALKIDVPKYFPMFVTFLQIMQMAIACVVCWFCYNMKESNIPCDISPHTSRLCLAWYSVSLVLFSAFFYSKYLAPKNASTKSKSM